MGRTTVKNTSIGYAPGIVCGIIMLIIFTLAQGAQAADWPMFRHDLNHTGVSEEIVEPPLELLWESGIGGSHMSSPAVSGGIVYVGGYDVLYEVHALDAATGAPKWAYKTGYFVMSSPAVSGGIVYVGSMDNNVYALDAATGALKWNYTTGDWIESSPAVSGGIVYVGSYDGNVYALDAVTGALKWKYKTQGRIISSPAVSGGVVYVSGYYEVIALDATTGTLKWKYTDLYYEITSSPAVSGGVVYVGGHGVRALDAATGALKRNYPTGEVQSSPAVSGGVVYVGSNDDKVYAFDAATGALKWNYTTGSWVTSSPAISGGVVYVASLDGNLYAFVPSSIPPNIISFSPPTPVSDVAGSIREFNITTDQLVNVTWLINGTQIQTNKSVTSAKYVNTSATSGIWNVTAFAENSNGSAMQTWIWIVKAAKTVKATIDIDPNTLNLKSKGKWITAYIELPKGYNVKKTNVSTIKLMTPSGKAMTVDPTVPAIIGDYDGDSVSDLMVKFNRANLIAYLSAGNKVKLTITGKLMDGTVIEGNDTIRVIGKIK